VGTVIEFALALVVVLKDRQTSLRLEKAMVALTLLP